MLFAAAAAAGETEVFPWFCHFEALPLNFFFLALLNLQDEEKIKVKGEVHRLIAPRDQKHQSNFVEFRNLKIVYRRYAGLFFCVCVDANDNELAYLEAIHYFVEVLDAFFTNVCELDLVFNFYKVCLSVFFFLVVRFGELRASFVDVCFLLRFMPFWMRFFLRARLRRRVKKLCLEGWSI